MDLFTYLMTKKGHNLSTRGDLFSYLLGKANQLPSEYQRLEYIETNNYGNYIDTGYIPTQNTKLEISYMDIANFSENPRPNYCNFFGASSGGENAGINIGMAISGTLSLRFDGKTFTVPLTTTGTRLTDISSKDGYYRNGVKIHSWGSYQDFTFNHNVYIFGSNTGNDTPSTWQRNARVYYAKIYDNNKLVKNFVPCLRKTDNELGMYDTISKQFYTNQGTGKFGYNEYTFVEYIESTGTQYIDTGVNADDINYAFEIDFYGYQTQPTQYPRVFGYQYQGGIFLGTKFWYGNNTNTNSTDSLNVFNDERHLLFANKDYAIVDNTTFLINTPPTSLTKFNSNKIAIFGSIHGNTGLIRNDDFSSIKLYNFKIYHSNKLIRNFIPCIRNSDNEIGLYDMVNGTFYGNAGTGTFGIPNNVQLNSLQSPNLQTMDILSPNLETLDIEPNNDEIEEVENEVQENMEQQDI